MTIPRFTLGEKAIGDGPRSPKCFLGQIRAHKGVDKGSIRGQILKLVYGRDGWLFLGLHRVRSRLVMVPDPQNAFLVR